MDGGDYNNGGYDQDGGRRRKRSFDDAPGNGGGGSRQDNYDPRYGNSGGGNGNGGGGYHKRARYDDRNQNNNNYRPRDNYRRDDDRNYNNNYNNRPRGGNGRPSTGRYDDAGRADRFSSGGSASGESDRARAWRLMKKAVVELGEASQLGDDIRDTVALREHLNAAAALVLAELDASSDDSAKHSKQQHIAALLLRCVGSLAHKTALLAVLVGVVYAKQPAFGRAIVDATATALTRDVAFFTTNRSDASDHDALRAKGDVAAIALRVRLLLRFIGALGTTRVVASSDVIALLSSLQSTCVPLDFVEHDGEATNEATLRVREDAAAFKDFVATIVLDTLVHSGRALAIDCSDAYDALVARCFAYVASREIESNPRRSDATDHATSWLVRRVRLDLVWEPETDEEQSAFCKRVDPLALLADALRVAPASDNAPIPGIAHPQALFATLFSANEPLALSLSLAIDLTTIDSRKIPPYAALFRILSDDSGAAGAAIANLPLPTYLVARSYLLDALQTFQPKPAMAAKQLLALCTNLNARFATDASTPIKSEFLLLETLFVAALTDAAATPATLAYDCAVLTHLIKADARVVSAAVAIVVELLFREMAFLRAASVELLVQIFSFFLANFEFKWPWANWTHVLDAREDDAQRLFVSAVIERCVRLSYLQHMQTVLPTAFHMLLPPAPLPRIRFQRSTVVAAAGRVTATSSSDALVDATAGAAIDTEDEAAGTPTPATRALYVAITTKLQTHPPAAAFESWLTEYVVAARDDLDVRDVVEVVWTCLLEAGAATFTHMRLLLDKYGRELFASSCGDRRRTSEEEDASSSAPLSREDVELLVVKTVGSVWLKSPQHIQLILHMMLQQKLLQATTIATWLFTPDAVQQYSWPYVWGILHDTMAFVDATIADTTRVLAAAAAAQSTTLMSGEDHEDANMVDVVAVEAARHQLETELSHILVVLFEGFNRVVTEHKSTCDADGVAYKDNWFVSALAQLKAIGGRFRFALDRVADDLATRVFGTHSADHDVKKVFQFVLDSYRSSSSSSSA